MLDVTGGAFSIKLIADSLNSAASKSCRCHIIAVGQIEQNAYYRLVLFAFVIYVFICLFLFRLFCQQPGMDIESISAGAESGE